LVECFGQVAESLYSLTRILWNLSFIMVKKMV